MKKSVVISVVTSLAVTGTLSGTAHAGSCQDAGELATKLVEAANKLCTQSGGRFKNCDAKKLGTAVNEVDYWVKWWNSTVGNTAAKLGPRSLAYNATDKGTILNPGVRTWISLEPSAGRAKLQIKALGGKAGMEVSYCAVNADGRIDFLGTDTAGGGQSPPLRELSEDQVGGKFIIVKMDGTGGALKKYEYEINLNGTPVR